MRKLLLFILMLGSSFISLGQNINSNGQRIKSELLLADSLIVISKRLGSADQYDSLYTFIHSAKKIYAEQKLWGEVMQSDILAAYYALNQGEYKKAKLFAESAIEIGNNHISKTDPIFGLAFQRYGKSLGYLGDHQESLGYYLKALDIYKIPGNQNNQILKDELADCFVGIGITYNNNGDYFLAIDFYQQGINIKKKLFGENSPQLAFPYGELGISLWHVEKYQEALDLYDLVINLMDSSKNDSSHDYGSTYNNIALNYWSLGKSFEDSIPKFKYFDKAAELFEKAENIWRSRVVIHPELARIINNRGMVYDDRYIYTKDTLDFNKAVSLYIAALDMKESLLGPRHPNISRSFNNLGALYLEAEKYPEALEYLHKVVLAQVPNFANHDVSQLPEFAGFLDGRQLIYALKKKAEAFTNMYNHSSNLDMLKASLLHYEYFSDVISEMRKGYKSIDTKNYLIDKYYSTYEDAIKICDLLYNNTNNQLYLDKAWEFMECVKSLSLYESLVLKHKLSIDIEIDSQLVDHMEMLGKRLLMFEKKIHTAEAKDSLNISIWSDSVRHYQNSYHLTGLQLEKSSPEFYQLRYKSSSSSLEDFKIPIGTLILEYFVGGEEMFILGISNAGLTLNRQIKDQDFLEDLDKLRSIIHQYPGSSKNLDFNQFANASNSIYQKLIQPLLGNSPKLLLENLVIIADDTLSYIPFEVLLTEMPVTRNYIGAVPNYLINKYPISYAYSTHLYFLENNKKEAIGEQNNYLGVAPEFDGIVTSHNSRGCQLELQPLTHNAKEIEYVNEVLKGKVLIGKEATLTNYLKHLSNSKIVHLATHACVNDLDPMYSKIFFTQMEDSINYVYTKDLFNSTINAELVYLSACNTGSGLPIKGEGMLCLSQGFAYAGCPNVISSLWEVNDFATTEIAKGFFVNFEQGNSKSKSLQLAKLDFLRNADELTAHPYFWSPHVLLESIEKPFKSQLEKYTYLYMIMGFFGIFVLFYFIRSGLMVKNN